MRVIDVNEKIEYREYPDVKELYDSFRSKVVLFSLAEGQEIPPHVSSSEVIMLVMDGEGSFHSKNGETEVKAGTIAFCEPDEPHGMKAKEKMVVLAFIIPNPSINP
jgi:quercetin dioxygenase-like cupin family protein